MNIEYILFDIRLGDELGDKLEITMDVLDLCCCVLNYNSESL